MSLSRIHDRLFNRGRYSRLDEESIRSCIAGFWSQWIARKGWMAEWGDEDTAPDVDDNAIDMEDGARLDAYIKQLAFGHRVTLIRRYAHGHKPQTPYERDSLRMAIDALADAMGENTRTVRHIRILVRGRA